MTDVVQQLRHAYSRLTTARQAAMVAENAIDEGRDVFDRDTMGSLRPQVDQICRLGRDAADDVRLAHIAIVAAQQFIDDYCVAVAGRGLAEFTPALGPSTARSGTPTALEAAPTDTGSPPNTNADRN
ncbi:hypothetical protein FHR81_001772 [Actinoalloteichus hoggarensis]|uniref:hypothetical protein n=1 Tax=Actinoalloteichus hoggarensis TaxID=1470176 RepID=UPI000B8B300E|nr:hypothetical protein [Actinoalloteichus hoggarensis]MBB5920734.1 hypothetical protein [Actinoalloteichus hoggarensis]